MRLSLCTSCVHGVCSNRTVTLGTVTCTFMSTYHAITCIWAWLTNHVGVVRVCTLFDSILVDSHSLPFFSSRWRHVGLYSIQEVPNYSSLVTFRCCWGEIVQRIRSAGRSEPSTHPDHRRSRTAGLRISQRDAVSHIHTHTPQWQCETVAILVSDSRT